MDEPEELKNKEKPESRDNNPKGIKGDDSSGGQYPGRKYVEIGPYLGLGVQLAASIVLMFFLGYWLDSKLGSSPVLTIIMSFLGGFAGIYNVIKTVLDINRREKNEKRH